MPLFLDPRRRDSRFEVVLKADAGLDPPPKFLVRVFDGRDEEEFFRLTRAVGDAVYDADLRSALLAAAAFAVDGCRDMADPDTGETIGFTPGMLESLKLHELTELVNRATELNLTGGIDRGNSGSPSSSDGGGSAATAAPADATTARARPSRSSSPAPAATAAGAMTATTAS